MLTGDKLETAESIGYSSKLLNSDTDILRIRDQFDVEIQFNEAKAIEHTELIMAGHQRAIIIEASALKLLFESKICQRWFVKIARSCATVICCRVSPS